MLRVRTILCATLLLLLAATVGQAQEFRSIEITAWASGFESASAVTTMVNYADSCNLNCVIPEIRLRCDAYYTSSIEPPGTGVVPSPPGFDSLADVIAKAHPLGIEVHPWLVTWRIWTTVTGPGHTTPEHIWWTHGPGNTDPAQDWMMYSDTGAWDYGGIVNLDPGVPAVEEYLITVFMDIVTRYDVDGLNLDYIRYPATNWGYNPVSVARFNAEYGRTGNPSSSDTTWLNWRRDQITNLVKRLYLEMKAVKPLVKLNADVWNSATTGNNSYLQNWDNWMLNHWMDFAHPMSYTSTNSTFDSWCAAYVGNQHGRHVYPLVDASNSITGNVIPQINSVRSYGFSGLGLYSYQSIVDKPGLQSALVSGPFPTKVLPADMPWLSAPTFGMLKGRILNGAGSPIYPATVTVQSRNTKNTGTGFYGFVDLTTGTYTVSATAPGYIGNTGQATITAGQVTTLNITLGTDTTPPTISNVRTANVQATNAQILWDTNEGATSQVEYGPTISYGSTTTEDMALVTAHTVQLTNLTANTPYHYRVKSRDGAGNQAVSDDYTFTTATGDVVADIIIDNPAATLVGSWTTGTTATDKYGTNYYYCTTASSETKSARWTPNIITAGNYNVYVWYPQGSNRSARAPYTVYWNGGSATTNVNQQTNGGMWNLIASAKPFLVGTGGSVKVGNGTGETSLNVMADAVKFVYVPGADTQAPTVPTNLTATPASCTQVNLSWTASTDNVAVTGYKVFRNGGQIGTSATTTYSDSTCSPSTAYTYTVSAYDAAGNNSAQSAPATATTPADTTPPSTPTNLTATPVSGTQVNLPWTASTDNIAVTGYKVYRNSAQIGTSATTSYSDNNCTPATTYTYEVSAYDAASNESPKSAPAVATTPDTLPPSVPTNLSGTPVSETQVNLSWTASTDNVGVTGYKVFRNAGQIGTSATTSYSDSTCSPSTTYTYTVSAYDAAGNNSAQSAPAVVTTPDLTPPSISNVGSTPAQTTCTVTWTTNEAATSQVEYGLNTSYGSLTTLDPTLVTAHSVQVSGLTASTLYHYRVRSKDAANNEGISTDYTFTTTGGGVADIIIDNPAATYTGTWTLGTSSTDKYGADYQYATTATSETATAVFRPTIATAGNYDVYVWYPQGSNRSTAAPYTVYYNGGSVTVPVNQTTGGGTWNLIASAKSFLAGTTGYVKLGNGTSEASKVVMADAVKFVYVPGVSVKDYAPTAITLTRGTVSSGSVANLAANDASYLVITAANVGGTRYVDWYSSVSITEAPASVTKLTITFDGKLSASLNQKLYLYNFSTSSWTQIDSRTVGTSDVTVNWNTTSPASYISGTGQIRLRQYVTRTSSFTSSTDWVKFNIEY